MCEKWGCLLFYLLSLVHASQIIARLLLSLLYYCFIRSNDSIQMAYKRTKWWNRRGRAAQIAMNHWTNWIQLIWVLSSIVCYRYFPKNDQGRNNKSVERSRLNIQWLEHVLNGIIRFDQPKKMCLIKSKRIKKAGSYVNEKEMKNGLEEREIYR